MSKNQGSGSKSNRGFAAMDKNEQHEIAKKGGHASHGGQSSGNQGKSEAGRKGGESVPTEERSFSKDPELAREAGKKGGQSSH